jgi:phenylacetate-CoA ligase
MSETCLQDLLGYVTRHVPFYQAHTAPHGSALRGFPILGRTEIATDPDRFVSDEFAPARRLLHTHIRRVQSAPADTMEAWLTDSITVEKTSGTSGAPLYCLKHVTERAALGLAIWRQRRCIDPSVSPRRMFLFNHTGARPSPPGIHDETVGKVLAVYEAVAAAGATWLHAPPSVLGRHLDMFAGVEEVSLPRLRYIECNGEWLDGGLRGRIQEAFGATVINQYGTVESWTIALTCRHHVLHVNTDNILLELLDDSGQVITEPYCAGSIAITTLRLRMMPFVRYLTGDYGFYRTKHCPCGLSGTAIGLLPGRENQLIRGRAGRVFGNSVFAEVLCRVYNAMGTSSVTYVQVVQEEPCSFVLYTNGIPCPDRFFALFCRYAREALGEHLAFTHQLLDPAQVKRRQGNKELLFVSLCPPLGVGPGGLRLNRPSTGPLHEAGGGATRQTR